MYTGVTNYRCINCLSQYIKQIILQILLNCVWSTIDSFNRNKQNFLQNELQPAKSFIYIDYPSHHFECPLLLITGVYVNKFSRKLSGYKRIHVMSFYNETDIGLQNESNEGPV